MAYSTTRTYHPFIRFLTDVGGYGPLPIGLGLLFYALYGQWRRASSPKAYDLRELTVFGPNRRTSVQRWREFLVYAPDVADWADRGLLFNSPGEWPDSWPDDWPPWVHPTYLQRAFGGTNRLASTPNGAALKGWTARAGMPELFAYVAGVPLRRKQEAQARRGARSLLQTPQFLTWAYNVPVHMYPRTDISPLLTAGPLHRLEIDPLSVEDADVLKALPPWLLDPEALISRARTFDPLRTKAPDYVRYPDDELLGRNGRHLAELGTPVPMEKKKGHKATWAKDRVPLYLTV